MTSSARRGRRRRDAEALRGTARRGGDGFDKAGQAEKQVERERAALVTLDESEKCLAEIAYQAQEAGFDARMADSSALAEAAIAAFAQLQRVRAAEEEAATTRAAADDAADMAKVARREPASSTRPVSIGPRLERADARRWLARHRADVGR